MKLFENYQNKYANTSRPFGLLFVNPEYQRLEAFDITIVFTERGSGKFHNYTAVLNKYEQDEDAKSILDYLSDNWDFCKHNIIIDASNDWLEHKEVRSLYSANTVATLRVEAVDKPIELRQRQLIAQFFDKTIFKDKSLKTRIEDEIVQNGTTSRSIVSLVKGIEQLQKKLRYH